MTDLPQPLFAVTAEEVRGGVLLRLAGGLDHETADELVDAVRARPALAAPGELRLDCAQPASCDSTGLSALLMVRRLTAAAGTALRLLAPGPQLTRMPRSPAPSAI
ncbi:STAS domain-containing protein [Streptomyces sp. NPDC047002]|uniref:STAS domain-containing protein n=1 Tax=Streptomyces sp. NPDC047002 TaxID=3155475 RepID=UPI0034529204